MIQQTTNGTRGTFAAGQRRLVLCSAFVTEDAAGAVGFVVTDGDEDLLRLEPV